MEYSLSLPRQIVFGWDSRTQLGKLAGVIAQRVWLVTGGSSLEQTGVLQELLESLAAAGISVTRIGRALREPTIEDVDAVSAELQQHGAGPGDAILAVGGGSVIDLAKAAAGMATNARGRSVREFLEGVGTGACLEADPLPLIALPTTAGTGTEATRNAVISVANPPCKKSLRDPRLVPALAIIDPALTVSCRPEVTAHSGMDAITQLIESYLSCKANPFTRGLCLTGLSNLQHAIRTAVRHPADIPARTALAQGALYSGMALANSGLGFAHGVAAALGAEAGVPHGLACAVLLPIALRVNCGHLPGSQAEERDRAARLISSFTGGDSLSTGDCDLAVLAELIEELNAELGIPARLRELGVRREMLPQLAAGSLGNSMNGNPRRLNSGEILQVLEDNW